MKNKPALILSFFIICFSTLTSLGQSNSTIKNSFIIHAASLSKSDEAFYTKSIEAADFEQFRLKDQPLILKFKNGFTLELLSAKDLLVKNIAPSIDINKYSNYPALPNHRYPLFEILNTGWVTAAVDPTNTKTN
ncbi:MAG: hypothetical protein HYX39_13965 [Bacteroidetes bacterium]|nr:hypothetical protein [Bacteroidota bacterium]